MVADAAGGRGAEGDPSARLDASTAARRRWLVIAVCAPLAVLAALVLARLDHSPRFWVAMFLATSGFQAVRLHHDTQVAWSHALRSAVGLSSLWFAFVPPSIVNVATDSPALYVLTLVASLAAWAVVAFAIRRSVGRRGPPAAPRRLG